MPVSLDAFRKLVSERLHEKYGVPTHFLVSHIFAKTYPLDRDVRAAFWTQYDDEYRGTSAEPDLSKIVKRAAAGIVEKLGPVQTVIALDLAGLAASRPRWSFEEMFLAGNTSRGFDWVIAEGFTNRDGSIIHVDFGATGRQVALSMFYRLDSGTWTLAGPDRYKPARSGTPLSQQEAENLAASLHTRGHRAAIALLKPSDLAWRLVGRVRWTT